MGYCYRYKIQTVPVLTCIDSQDIKFRADACTFAKGMYKGDPIKWHPYHLEIYVWCVGISRHIFKNGKLEKIYR